jgi:aldose 1-epimerase
MIHQHPNRYMQSNLLFRFLVIGMLVATACNQPSVKNYMSIQKENWGKSPEGRDIFLYTLENGNGVSAGITNFGGIVVFLKVPSKKGGPEDIVLGFDSLKPYLNEHPYFGALIGRYGNRIAEGKFVIDGKEYLLAKNNGSNSLHGGIKGFDKVVWDAETVRDSSFVGLKLSYLSPDGEEGYPGNLKVTVIYRLTKNNGLEIEYEAETDKPTPVNLTHHSYFNLKGSQYGDILDHKIVIKADRYTVVNDQLIPTGELRPVGNTPFDYSHYTSIGSRINQVPGGYDHNYVLSKKPGEYSLVAGVTEPVSGRSMEVYTTEPGLQFYSGNFLDGTLKGKGGRMYQKHDGFCMEAQHFPDSPNQPSFPPVILHPGEKYHQKTAYRFIW